MNTLKTMIKAILYPLLLLFILFVGLLGFLLSTTPGIYTSVKLANLILPGNISIKKPNGRLIDHFSLGQLSYHDKEHTLVFKNLSLHWHPASLLFKKHLLIKTFKAEQLSLSVAPATAEATDAPFQWPQLPVRITVEQAFLKQMKLLETGQLFSDIHLRSSFSEHQWQLNQLSLTYKDIRFVLNSTLSPMAPYPMQAVLSIEKTTAEGMQLKGRLTAGGDLSLYHWEGQFQQPAALQVKGTLKNGTYLENVVQWQEIKWPLNQQTSVQSGKGRLSIKGPLAHLDMDLDTALLAPAEGHWQLHVQQHEKQLSANSILRLDQGSLHGQLQIDPQEKNQFTGAISSENLDLSHLIPGLNKLRLESRFSGEKLDALSLHASAQARYWGQDLKASADFNQQKLKAQANLGSNTLQLSGTLPYQWNAYINVPQPALLHPSLEGFNARITANASLLDAKHGRLNLTLNNGYYQLPDDSPMTALHFDGGSLDAQLNPEGLSADGRFTIDAQKTLTLSLKLPRFNLNEGLQRQQAIEGKLDLAVNSLQFLDNLSPHIKNAQGRLTVNLSTGGSLYKPVTEGDIRLDNAAVFLPQSGLHLSGIDGRLLSRNNAWQLEGSMASKEGPLSMKGEGLFYPEASGEIRVQGNNVQLFETSEYSLNVSPDLLIKFSGYTTDISGSLVIPKARINPQHFTESVSLSNDVVFIDKKEQQRTAANISADVNVIMGNEVKLDVQGLKGFLDGAVRLRQLPGGNLNASGNLSIRQGAYKAYGQDLKIDQGELIFTGGLLTNPGINLRAVRHFSNSHISLSGSNQLFDFSRSNLQDFSFAPNVTVGVEVTGRLNSPDVQLFSTPAGMPQADILSMLLLGRPAHQADRAGGQLLLSAISAMNLDAGTRGTQLLTQLKENLGFDFDMQTTSAYNRQTHTVSESNQFVIGKALSKRLYLSYNIGILQTDLNVLTLRYLLNKYFSIQVTASDTGNGIDFLYTSQKK